MKKPVSALLDLQCESMSTAYFIEAINQGRDADHGLSRIPGGRVHGSRVHGHMTEVLKWGNLRSCPEMPGNITMGAWSLEAEERIKCILRNSGLVTEI
jgi:hypothetical protein